MNMNRIATWLSETVASEIDIGFDETNAGAAFEKRLMEKLMGIGREALEVFLGRLEPLDREVEEGEEVWKLAVMSSKTFTSTFGDVRIERGLYRAKRNGPTRCFVEERFGMLDSWTSEAARLCALLLTDQTSRFAARFLSEQGAMTPPRTKLERLPTRIGQTMEAYREELNAELRRGHKVPEAAVTVAVSLDGVMVKLKGSSRRELVEKANEEGRKVGGPVGSREASVGALTFYDEEGERISTRRFARMPEANKSTLKQMLRAELATVLETRPDLTVVALSDGAANHWSFLESLQPDHLVVDAWHTLEHLKRRLDSALGVNTQAHQTEYARMKDILLREPDGHAKVFEKLRDIEKENGTFKERKTSGRGAQPTFYQRHRQRMQYARHHAMNLPLGSGVIEGTARYMVVDRLRRTGMRWKLAGGQAILTLRQYAANDDFNNAWDKIMRLEAANTDTVRLAA